MKNLKVVSQIDKYNKIKKQVVDLSEQLLILKEDIGALKERVHFLENEHRYRL